MQGFDLAGASGHGAGCIWAAREMFRLFPLLSCSVASTTPWRAQSREDVPIDVPSVVNGDSRKVFFAVIKIVNASCCGVENERLSSYHHHVPCSRRCWPAPREWPLWL